MTHFVKEFINKNISAIEKGEWEDVLDAWMETATDEFLYTDDNFNDLSTTLETAGIPFLGHIIPVRESTLRKYLYTSLDNAYNVMTYYGRREIYKNNVLQEIPSLLGFTEEEVYNIMDDMAADEFSLEVEDDLYIL